MHLVDSDFHMLMHWVIISTISVSFTVDSTEFG